MTLEVYGEIKKATETGDGPVDAIFKCIKKLYPHEVKLQLYQVNAVTEGTDARSGITLVKAPEKLLHIQASLTNLRTSALGMQL